METALSIIVGVGLSAACGFRVFVPMLGTSIAALSGHLQLADGFGWIGTPAAAIGFGTATLIEIGAYYVPWLDNLLDTISTPAAIVAGTIMTASMVVDMSPFLKWSLAIITGGGAAGVIQGGAATLRAVSTGTTGGMANPVFSTLEWIGSLVMTILAVVMPVLAGLLVVALIVVAIVVLRRFWGFWRKQRSAAAGAADAEEGTE
jgi:Domain of unknown function (DUF4126)